MGKPENPWHGGGLIESSEPTREQKVLILGEILALPAHALVSAGERTRVAIGSRERSIHLAFALVMGFRPSSPDSSLERCCAILAQPLTSAHPDLVHPDLADRYVCNQVKEFSSWLAPFHRICTPIHTRRNAESLSTTVIPVGPIMAPSLSAKA